MNDLAHPRGDKALLVIAGLLAVTLLGLLTFAARSQNGNSFVATFQGYDGAGEELWTVERDIDQAPSFKGDRIVFSTRGDGSAVTVDGDVVSYDGPQRIGSETRIADVTYGSKGWPPVTTARDAAGVELWRSEGSSFVDAGRDVAILRVETAKGPVISRTGRATHHIVAAQTGELLGKYAGPRSRRPVAGDGVAAYISAGMLTTVSLDGTRSVVVDDIGRKARVVLVEDGIVMIDQPDDGGRLLRGFELATGTSLWSVSLESFDWYSDAGRFVAYTNDGPIDLDIETGKVSGPWSDVVRNGVVEASVAEVVESAASGAIRHLRHGAGTIAVDATSDSVLWLDPIRYPIATAEDVAVFRGADEFEIVEARTGETRATVGRAGRSSVAVGEGHALVASEGRVYVVDANGAVNQIGKIRHGARARAISDRYALVIVKSDPNNKPQAVVFDIATGEQIARHRVKPFSQVLIDAHRIVLHHGPNNDTVIDLTTSEISRVDTDLFSPKPPPWRELAAVFDASRQRLLWEQPLDHNSTVGTIGDAIVVIRVGSKRDGVTKYAETGS